MKHGGLLKADYDPLIDPPWSIKWPTGISVSYDEVVGSLAFAESKSEGDLGLHAGVVLGKCPDSSFELLWEIQAKAPGDLLSLGIELTNMKDLLRFQDILITPEESADQYKRFLRSLDGLTEYQILGQEDPYNPLTIKWAHDIEHWPHFVDRRTTAGLVNVPLHIITDFPSSVNSVRQLWNAGRFRIEQRHCPMSLVSMQLPYDDLVESPLARAIIQGVATLTLWNEQTGSVGSVNNEPWYGNRGGING